MYLNLREYINFWGEEKNFCVTNSLTNDIFILDKSYYDFIETYHDKEINEADLTGNKILSDLINNDIVFLTKKKLYVENHLKIMEKFYNIFADDKRKFFALNIEVTTKCDNSCEHCSGNDIAFNCMKDCFKSNKVIDIEKTKYIIDDFINRGGKSIKISGGNIFLAENELEKLCKYIRGKSKTVALILNLVSVDNYEKRISYFIDKYKCLIEVSIFDFETNMDLYYTFFKNFKHIKYISLVKFFLSTENMLPAKLLEVINLNNILVQVNNFFSNSDEYLKLYHSLESCSSINPEHLNSIDYLDKNRCFNGIYHYSVDNYFIPCVKVRYENLGQTLTEVVESKKYNHLLEYTPKNISKCDGCGLIEFCKPCYYFKDFFEQGGDCFEQR